MLVDNLPARKVNGLRDAIAASRSEPLFLQPYSADFNPVEHAGTRFKQSSCSPEPRATEAPAALRFFFLQPNSQRTPPKERPL